ncbi:hypothetical protein KFK09_004040 [Dendrobium nobile]|uniref:Uncharacterized protein n=1 Tax=Dendrobium nobile TaxID=94219 RepID=A0A8T3BZ86_DENNO|nr:hypothetical protein KFK09_004040 [Dendrobium nobile]
MEIRGRRLGWSQGKGDRLQLEEVSEWEEVKLKAAFARVINDENGPSRASLSSNSGDKTGAAPICTR